MEAQQLKMDVTANNLANTNTTGFKRGRAEFEDLLSENIRVASAPEPQGGAAPAPLEVGLGVRTGTTTRSFSQGDMLTTNNPLDVAIQGQGFFRVMRPNGETAYTRAGNFRVDAAGRLTTQHGLLVQPEINVPGDVSDITIQPDGKVLGKQPGRAEQIELGRLELSMFTNPNGLQSIGENLLLPTGASGEAMNLTPGEQGSGNLAQGFLEGSNVKAVEEMINMITVQRGYEMNSKVIQTADQMLQRLTNMR
jgi:flagellar basal-body rod protein FlgG